MMVARGYTKDIVVKEGPQRGMRHDATGAYETQSQKLGSASPWRLMVWKIGMLCSRWLRCCQAGAYRKIIDLRNLVLAQGMKLKNMWECSPAQDTTAVGWLADKCCISESEGAKAEQTCCLETPQHAQTLQTS